jgi:glycosyltransferase involved in cell wall biosynthesis
MFESYSLGHHASKFIIKHKNEIESIYFMVWPIFAQYKIAKTAKRYSIPSVVHVQDIYPESLTNKLFIFKQIIYHIFLPTNIKTLKSCSAVVTISEKMRDYLIRTRSLDPLKVNSVYNWQNETEFLSFNKLEKSETRKIFTFMFLGSLSPTAAIDVLITTFGNCFTQSCRLIIAGNGSQKEYLKELARRYPQAIIEFIDAPAEKVPEIQNRSDVLVLGLKKGAAGFALPSKMIAYMLSKRPIIAYIDEDSEPADIIKKAKCGWVVPPENPFELSNTISSAMNLSEAALAKLGDNGFRFAINNFTRHDNLIKLKTIILNTI